MLLFWRRSRGQISRVASLLANFVGARGKQMAGPQPAPPPNIARFRIAQATQAEKAVKKKLRPFIFSNFLWSHSIKQIMKIDICHIHLYLSWNLMNPMAPPSDVMNEQTVLTHALVNWCTASSCCIGSDWANFTVCHLFILLIRSIGATFAWTNTIVNRVATCATDSCNKGKINKIILITRRLRVE